MCSHTIRSQVSKSRTSAPLPVYTANRGSILLLLLLLLCCLFLAKRTTTRNGVASADIGTIINDFDIILGRFPRGSQCRAIPHTLCPALLGIPTRWILNWACAPCCARLASSGTAHVTAHQARHTKQVGSATPATWQVSRRNNGPGCHAKVRHRFCVLHLGFPPHPARPCAPCVLGDGTR